MFDNEAGTSYAPLAGLIFWIIILVSFSPLALMMAVAAYEFNTAYREKSLGFMEQVVEKHAQGIDSFLEEKRSEIKMLSLTHSFSELADDATLHRLLAALQKNRGGVFVDLGLIDSKGRQVSYAGPYSLKGADYGPAPWFLKAVKGDSRPSDVFLGLRGLPHFIVAVRGVDHKEPYVLRGTIDFAAFNQLVENIGSGASNQAFIINQEGNLQTQPRVRPDPGAVKLPDSIWAARTGAAYGDRPFEWEGYAGAGAHTHRPVIHFFGKNPADGQKAVFVAASLKNGEWALVHIKNLREIFAPLYEARRITLALFITGGLAIVIMAAFLSRRVAKKIGRVAHQHEIMNEKVMEAGKLASLGELAAGIAHEINNPVAIMVEESGWIGDLLEEPEFSDTENVREIRRTLAQIQVQGVRCKQITHKLLSFARKTDPVKKEVQLNDLVREVTELSSQHAKFANVRIKTELSPDLPLIMASPSEIQQVILNLINNAIDAIPPHEGGVVSLVTRTEGDEAVLSVSDTGAGIPEANIKRIFDPFYTTKPVGKGTGLGLSIVYGIIKKLGGRVAVNSQANMGTTFHLFFPLPGNPSGQGAETDNTGANEP